MIEPFLTIKQLIAKGTIPLGKTKLYEFMQTGLIRSYRVGGKLMVLESEVWQDIKNRFHLRAVNRGIANVR